MRVHYSEFLYKTFPINRKSATIVVTTSTRFAKCLIHESKWITCRQSQIPIHRAIHRSRATYPTDEPPYSQKVLSALKRLLRILAHRVIYTEYKRASAEDWSPAEFRRSKDAAGRSSLSRAKLMAHADYCREWERKSSSAPASVALYSRTRVLANGGREISAAIRQGFR